MKTAQEIETLKAQWCADPCWDIEDTEGFEAHREELRAYRQDVEQQAERFWQEYLQAKAVTLGCPGNTALAEAFNDLAHQVRQLREELEALKGP